MGAIAASIIIRTLNEERYIGEVLSEVFSQSQSDIEVLIVDSGSTDSTLEIVKSFPCRLLSIDRHSFSFGGSLNIGCQEAAGDILVFLSGHCIPLDSDWLRALIEPIQSGEVDYCYGAQRGGDASNWGEICYFFCCFPEHSKIPQVDYFCNNANAALRKSCWRAFPFDESLTGLEDQFLAKKLQSEGFSVGYQAEAKVWHHHHENAKQIRNRFEREAIALQMITPEEAPGISASIIGAINNVGQDIWVLRENGWSFKRICESIVFRVMQSLGTYRGYHRSRAVTSQDREAYAYIPKDDEL